MLGFPGLENLLPYRKRSSGFRCRQSITTEEGGNVEIKKHSLPEKLTMQEPSVFVADCLCGRHFETISREYVCPVCHRHIRLDWRSDEPGLPTMVAGRSAPETSA